MDLDIGDTSTTGEASANFIIKDNVFFRSNNEHIEVDLEAEAFLGLYLKGNLLELAGEEGIEIDASTSGTKLEATFEDNTFIANDK